MPDDASQLKIAVSAIAGTLVAAMLVIVPGTIFIRPSMREPAQRIFALHDEIKPWGATLGPFHDAYLVELMTKTFWLCILQNQIDSLPFLLSAGCVGPALLMRQRSRRVR